MAVVAACMWSLHGKSMWVTSGGFRTLSTDCAPWPFWHGFAKGLRPWLHHWGISESPKRLLHCHLRSGWSIFQYSQNNRAGKPRSQKGPSSCFQAHKGFILPPQSIDSPSVVAVESLGEKSHHPHRKIRPIPSKKPQFQANYFQFLSDFTNLTMDFPIFPMAKSTFYHIKHQKIPGILQASARARPSGLRRSDRSTAWTWGTKKMIPANGTI
jgi:hypothetical protein